LFPDVPPVGGTTTNSPLPFAQNSILGCLDNLLECLVVEIECMVLNSSFPSTYPPRLSEKSLLICYVGYPDQYDAVNEKSRRIRKQVLAA